MVGNVDIIAIQRMRGGHFFLPCNLIPGLTKKV
jgi:hypothetical protein